MLKGDADLVKEGCLQLAHRLSSIQDLSFLQRQQTNHQILHCALTRPARPQKAEDFSFVNAERDVPYGVIATPLVVMIQVPHLNNAHRYSPVPIPFSRMARVCSNSSCTSALSKNAPTSCRLRLGASSSMILPSSLKTLLKICAASSSFISGAISPWALPCATSWRKKATLCSLMPLLKTGG